MSFLERVITTLPYRLTDRILFGPYRIAGPLQTAVQHVIGGPRAASITIDGHSFHCSTSEKYFFERENFERELWEVMLPLLGADDVVYDFGAHIGYWAIRLSRICKHVFAFEPSPLNFPRLCKNAADISNVTLVNAAIAAEEGKMRFTEAGSMSTLGAGDVVVQTIALDSFAATHLPPTFLLMDVEGYAGQVLRGALSLLTRKIPMVCEIHDHDEEKATIPTLRSLSYDISHIDRSCPYPFRILAT